ncbi:uncharacterized protein HRG_11478 [Hirsutella rhossiliensis]|uniref:DUF2406 domain-containing protein n=1 Tax=Hirsutella rhossiliensis TaxID=111463 RepID=A0A9P8SCA0_9HYPO|nr:uncharacterized protein HRG_11478 [Hirsutella rhossiliensis]KAH0957331.1 hypothetical protein HRG_11478 [Hirsutella rhossiliensis]
MAAPAEQYDHLLPQSSQHPRVQQRPNEQYSQQQRPQTKPRSYSVRSEKSHRSGGSKSDFPHESKTLQSKADPSMAINEAEPATMAVMEESNHVSLRSMQHKDTWGNPIADPDKSNPTRNRWERPLDTIRGFEAAIDGGYSRKSLIRSETQTSVSWSQQDGPRPPNQPRFPQDGYYSNRAPSGYGAGYNNGRPLPRDRSLRMHPDQQYQTHGREQNVYPMPHKDRSYETVTSAGGNSDPAGYQTDPTSSDNSSVDHRVAPAKRPGPNDHGIGFSQSQPGFAVSGGGNGHANHALPSPPAEAGHFDNGSNVPLKQSSALSRQVTPPHHDGPEKRKSWFSRRFSKDT